MPDIRMKKSSFMTKAAVRGARIAACLGLIVVLILNGCVTDDRKLFSPVRARISRSDPNELVEKKLLNFTPLGTDRADVNKFLTENFKDSAEIVLKDPPEFGETNAASSIYVPLWARAATSGGAFETSANYSFDKRKRLYRITVFTGDTADSSF